MRSHSIGGNHSLVREQNEVGLVVEVFAYVEGLGVPNVRLDAVQAHENEWYKITCHLDQDRSERFTETDPEVFMTVVTETHQQELAKEEPASEASLSVGSKLCLSAAS